MKESDSQIQRRENLTILIGASHLLASLVFLCAAYIEDNQPKVVYQLEKTPEEVMKINAEKNTRVKVGLGATFLVALQGAVLMTIFPSVAKSLSSSR